MWHEFADAVPVEGEFNVGYMKKWLVTSQDLDAMYTGKQCINLWCDGKVADEEEEEVTAPQGMKLKEVEERRSSMMYFNS